MSVDLTIAYPCVFCGAMTVQGDGVRVHVAEREYSGNSLELISVSAGTNKDKVVCWACIVGFKPALEKLHER